MLKLNRKGYLTVEIILASVIAVTIAFFLIEITMKLVSRTDDAYVDVNLITDKALITNKVLDDISNKGLKDISLMQEASGIFFEFTDGDTKELYIENNKFMYGNNSDSYEKKLKITFKDVNYSVKKGSNGYVNIKLTLKSLYSDYDYGFNIVTSLSS